MGYKVQADPARRRRGAETYAKPRKPRRGDTAASTTTPAGAGPSRRAVASRRNGRLGSRPRLPRGFDDFADVAEPPAHPVKLGHWMQHILAIDAQRIHESRDHESLSQEIRGYTVAMSKLLRPIILLAAADPDGAWWRDPGDAPPPADDPVAMAYWLLRTLARGLYACVHGRAHQGGKLRATVSAYVKAIPPDTLYDARDKVTNWARALEQTPGPQPKPAETPTDGLEERYQPIHC